MRRIFVCFLALFALTTTTALAGPGHSHGPITPITQAQALEKAASIVKNIANKGKIETSWAAVAPSSSEKKQGKYGPEWVVVFNNPKAEDKAKQTLYVFLTEGGDYIAANHTGN